jgi:hypothetical protein
LYEVNKLLTQGKKAKEIAKDLDLPILTVYNFIKYLDEISISEISPKVLGKRRKEIDVEYLEAIQEAKALFFKYKDPEYDEEGNVIREAKPSTAKGFYEKWTDTLQKRAKLYGLDNIKIESHQYNQFNNSNNSYDLSRDQIDSIAEALERGK